MKSVFLFYIVIKRVVQISQSIYWLVCSSLYNNTYYQLKSLLVHVILIIAFSLPWGWKEIMIDNAFGSTPYPTLDVVWLNMNSKQEKIFSNKKWNHWLKKWQSSFP